MPTYIPAGCPQSVLDALPPLDPVRVQAASAEVIQRLLDATAQSHGYDNIISLCTYAGSSNPEWQAEGQHGCNLRDAAWAKGQEIQDAVLAGQRELPTADQVRAEVQTVLSAMPWPEAA